jgi:hypothetical protein
MVAHVKVFHKKRLINSHEQEKKQTKKHHEENKNIRRGTESPSI